MNFEGQHHRRGGGPGKRRRPHSTQYESATGQPLSLVVGQAVSTAALLGLNPRVCSSSKAIVEEMSKRTSKTKTKTAEGGELTHMTMMRASFWLGSLTAPYRPQVKWSVAATPPNVKFVFNLAGLHAKGGPARDFCARGTAHLHPSLG